MQSIGGTDFAGAHLAKERIPQSLRQSGGLQPSRERCAGVRTSSRGCMRVHAIRGGRHERGRSGARQAGVELHGARVRRRVLITEPIGAKWFDVHQTWLGCSGSIRYHACASKTAPGFNDVRDGAVPCSKISHQRPVDGELESSVVPHPYRPYGATHWAICNYRGVCVATQSVCRHAVLSLALYMRLHGVVPAQAEAPGRQQIDAEARARQLAAPMQRAC